MSDKAKPRDVPCLPLEMVTFPTFDWERTAMCDALNVHLEKLSEDCRTLRKTGTRNEVVEDALFEILQSLRILAKKCDGGNDG